MDSQYTEDNPEYKVFITTLKSKINTCLSTLRMINLEKPSTIDISFLSFYNFLESFSKFYIKYNDKDYHFYMGVDDEVLNDYYFDKGTIKNKGEFKPKNSNDYPSWGKSLAGLFVEYFKISSSPYNEVKYLLEVHRWRNDYIHSTKNGFTSSELIKLVALCENSCSNLKD